MQTEISLAFADGEYLFRLPIKRIVALEAKTGPIDGVRHRLLNGGFGIQGVSETIREALIGGGKGMVSGVDVPVSPLKAAALINAYVDGRPIAEVGITSRALHMTPSVGSEPATKA